MSHVICKFLTAALCVVTLTVSAGSTIENWPEWRGPNGNGSAATSSFSYPVKWSGTNDFLWKTPLPGKGCSTPIVWNQQIFLTCPVDGNDGVMAIDWDGKILWRTAFGKEVPGKHQNASGCNSSPATDGKRIYVRFKSGTFAALNFSGKVEWKLNLVDKYGKDTLWWDYGTSVVLTENEVIVSAIQGGGYSYVAAVDKKTGQVRWKVDRNFTTAEEGDNSYATPFVFKENGKEHILVLGAERLTAHNSDTGVQEWVYGNLNPKGVKNWPTVASPVVADGLAIVPYARGEQLFTVKLDGRGDVSNTHGAWKQQGTGSFVPTPAVCDGRIYVLRDKGGVDCIEIKTGKIIWRGRFEQDSSNYYGSPTIANGKLYAVREDGIIQVAKVKDGLEALSQNDMEERMIASPVAVSGRLLLRGEKNLFCVGQK